LAWQKVMAVDCWVYDKATFGLTAKRPGLAPSPMLIKRICDYFTLLYCDVCELFRVTQVL